MKKSDEKCNTNLEQKPLRTEISEGEIGQGKVNVFDITGNMVAIRIRIPNWRDQKVLRILASLTRIIHSQ